MFYLLANVEAGRERAVYWDVFLPVVYIKIKKINMVA